MGWNGQDLVTEFSTQLGDQTDAFKSKVEGWLNDAERHICAEAAWSFLRVKGSKLMTVSTEEQSLVISSPSAPSVAVAAGGSLTASTDYYVKVTFYDPTNKVEKTSAASSVATTTASNKTINVTSIPLSTESFFTQRRVYLKKGTGSYFLYATIADNTTTTQSITADTTSKIQPPDFDYIRSIDGNLFYEASIGQLQFMPADQMRMIYSGEFGDGTPEIWADMGDGKVLLYPRPSATTAMKFYYFKIPRGIYNDADSVPTIPISLKNALKAWVIAYGYEYREREGWENKKQNAELELNKAIDSLRKLNSRTITTVRDTRGNSDGWSYN